MCLYAIHLSFCFSIINTPLLFCTVTYVDTSQPGLTVSGIRSFAARALLAYCVSAKVDPPSVSAAGEATQ
ncbi:hypothetical protein PR003_g7598 [Phytophthora rubi]|nr:hypothetical protein PR002_g7546 [Phytophthora rubi]KAE9040286.1 hypothetical protein PR001_g7144 [Phytophthora rubi]KAE9346111.1 hypothetical protein PR003_g7598 [Phytophthora rubi]